jgi:hypothetical protein
MPNRTNCILFGFSAGTRAWTQRVVTEFAHTWIAGGVALPELVAV